MGGARPPGDMGHPNLVGQVSHEGCRGKPFGYSSNRYNKPEGNYGHMGIRSALESVAYQTMDV